MASVTAEKLHFPQMDILYSCSLLIAKYCVHCWGVVVLPLGTTGTGFLEQYGKILHISLGAQILEHESKFK